MSPVPTVLLRPFPQSPVQTPPDNLQPKSPPTWCKKGSLTQKERGVLHRYRLLLQFSLRNEVAELFAPPPAVTTCLVLDTLKSRQSRKNRQNRDNYAPLLKESGPTEISLVIPETFLIPTVYHQRKRMRREGKVIEYTLFRLCLQPVKDEQKTDSRICDFLELLLAQRWSSRGYFNRGKKARDSFFSLNFTEPELTCDLCGRRPNRRIYLTRKAEIIMA